MTDAIRTLIVDDEEPARRLLAEYLAEHADVEVVGECANGFEAVKSVSELAPDLVLLDIQMPKLDGFDVIELLGDERPAVIFVTAYDEYAVSAFEVHALDYLLKPFDADRLAAALDRVRPELGKTPAVPTGELVRSGRPPGPAGRVLVRDGPKIHVLAADRIDYVEAQDDYVAFATGGEKLRKQQTMTELESTLDPGRFVRIHRSYLLNLDRLERLELYSKDSRLAILDDGTRLPVSRSGYARLKKLL